MTDKKFTKSSFQDSANNLRAMAPGSIERKSANGLQALAPSLVGNNANGLAAMAPNPVAQSGQKPPSAEAPKKS